MKPCKIKVCGICRPEDAAAINREKPDYFGMIIDFPSSHRSLTPEQAAEIRGLIDSNIPAVGVFVNRPIARIAELLKAGIVQIAQLHGSETEDDIRALQARCGKPVWKAFKIRQAADLDSARNSPADLILLDNGAGTGKSFDWSLVQQVGRPFALAGGLNPENLTRAISQVGPDIVDLSSGVETDKIKDPIKIQRAVQAVRTYGV